MGQVPSPQEKPEGSRKKEDNVDLLQVSSKVETQKNFNDIQTAYCPDFLSCSDQTLGMGPGKR